VIRPGEKLPLADQSIDMLVSDFTFEHIANPAVVAPEIKRVLKPGGWVCARTPNRWGYIGVAVNLVPNRLHVKFLKRLQRERKDFDVFPTVYRMNTFAQIERYFPASEFENFSYTHSPEPAYFGNSKTAWLAMMTLSRLLPRRFGATLHIFLRKRL
jgi:ubiquinone/menaquinone biosynthesis C-methylase UbiE